LPLSLSIPIGWNPKVKGEREKGQGEGNRRTCQIHFNQKRKTNYCKKQRGYRKKNGGGGSKKGGSGGQRKRGNKGPKKDPLGISGQAWGGEEETGAKNRRQKGRCYRRRWVSNVTLPKKKWGPMRGDGKGGDWRLHAKTST